MWWTRKGADRTVDGKRGRDDWRDDRARSASRKRAMEEAAETMEVIANSTANDEKKGRAKKIAEELEALKHDADPPEMRLKQLRSRLSTVESEEEKARK